MELRRNSDGRKPRELTSANISHMWSLETRTRNSLKLIPCQEILSVDALIFHSVQDESSSSNGATMEEGRSVITGRILVYLLMKIKCARRKMKNTKRRSSPGRGKAKLNSLLCERINNWLHAEIACVKMCFFLSLCAPLTGKFLERYKQFTTHNSLSFAFCSSAGKTIFLWRCANTYCEGNLASGCCMKCGEVTGKCHKQFHLDSYQLSFYKIIWRYRKPPRTNNHASSV